jgi:hypothetical protein
VKRDVVGGVGGRLGQTHGGARGAEQRGEQRCDPDGDEPAEEGAAPVQAAELLALAPHVGAHPCAGIGVVDARVARVVVAALRVRVEHLGGRTAAALLCVLHIPAPRDPRRCADARDDLYRHALPNTQSLPNTEDGLWC